MIDRILTWEVGILLRCAISPRLFLMAMDVVLRGAQTSAKGVEVAVGQVMPPMKAFMDYVTVLTENMSGVNQIVHQDWRA